MLRSPGPTPALHLRRGGQSRDSEGKRTGLLCPCGVDGPQQGRRHREGVRSLGATPTAGRTPVHRPERPGPAGLAPASSGSCGFAPCSAPGPGGPGGGSAAALTQPEGTLPCSVLALPSVFNDDSEPSPTASYADSSEPGVAGVGGQNEPKERAECVRAGRRQGPEQASLEGLGPPWTRAHGEGREIESQLLWLEAGPSGSPKLGRRRGGVGPFCAHAGS